MLYNIKEVKSLFPVLGRTVNQKPLIYLDNAASTQKPTVVIEAIDKYYREYNANIHRGVHTLADQATQAFEKTRKTAAKFLGTKATNNVIFTSGTTHAINTVAYSFCEAFLKEGESVLITGMEHHANIVPWQIHTKRKGANIKVIPLLADGQLDLAAIPELLTPKTKLLSLTHCNNATGIINPIEKIIEMAHKKNIPVLVDGAQAASFLDLEVDRWDVDFYTLSLHKVFGPTGVGLLYGKEKWLAQMPPFMSGGEMIKNVTFKETSFNELPYKFEAGTPNIAGVVASSEALDFVDSIGKENIRQHEQALIAYATAQLKRIDGVKIYGDVEHKASILSFIIEGLHPFDIGQLLDANGVAIRTGHHCTQPLMDFFGIEGTARMSFSLYNTIEEIDQTMEILKRIVKILKKK